VVVGVTAGLAWAAREGVHHLLDGTDKATVLLRLGAVGLVAASATRALARLFRIEEVAEVTRLFTARLRRRSGATG
jgi:hypothetical protein